MSPQKSVRIYKETLIKDLIARNIDQVNYRREISPNLMPKTMREYPNQLEMDITHTNTVSEISMKKVKVEKDPKANAVNLLAS